MKLVQLGFSKMVCNRALVDEITCVAEKVTLYELCYYCYSYYYYYLN